MITRLYFYSAITWRWFAAESAILDQHCDACRKNLAAIRFVVEAGNRANVLHCCAPCLRTDLSELKEE